MARTTAVLKPVWQSTSFRRIDMLQCDVTRARSPYSSTTSSTGFICQHNTLSLKCTRKELSNQRFVQTTTCYISQNKHQAGKHNRKFCSLCVKCLHVFGGESWHIDGGVVNQLLWQRVYAKSSWHRDWEKREQVISSNSSTISVHCFFFCFVFWGFFSICQINTYMFKFRFVNKTILPRERAMDVE